MRSATKKRTGRDREYLAFISSQPCYFCLLLAVRSNSPMRQKTRTEVCHVGTRGLSQKCPDWETIPACSEHHRTGRDSLHRLGFSFWKFWGVEKTDVIEHYQVLYEARYAA